MALETYKGVELTFTLPSGNQVKIREQNAADDEILSDVQTDDPGNRKSGLKNFNTFITRIVTYYSKTKTNYITLADVEELPLRDKYYILLKSRIHSLGSTLEFNWGCRNSKRCGEEFEVEDNLSELDQDLSLTPLKRPLIPGETNRAIQPYTDKDPYFEVELSSDKIIKLKHLTVASELKILELTETSLNNNTELYARNISIKTDDPVYKDGWQPLSDLGILSKAEVARLRKEVSEKDSQFILAKEIKCPNCGTLNVIPYSNLSDFFFPSEM